MKVVRVTDKYVEYYDEVWGTVKVQKWESFVREKEIMDKIDTASGGVNQKELEEGYDELCKEYIGAP